MKYTLWMVPKRNALISRFIEVAQVSPAEGATGVAAAACTGRVVFGILGAAQVDAPRGVKSAVACDARGSTQSNISTPR